MTCGILMVNSIKRHICPCMYLTTYSLTAMDIHTCSYSMEGDVCIVLYVATYKSADNPLTRPLQATQIEFLPVPPNLQF